MQVDVEDYTRFLRTELATLFPEAFSEAEATNHETRDVLVAADIWEQQDIAQVISQLLERYMRQER